MLVQNPTFDAVPPKLTTEDFLGTYHVTYATDALRMNGAESIASRALSIAFTKSSTGDIAAVMPRSAPSMARVPWYNAP